MTKKEIKQIAQDNILNGIRKSFYTAEKKEVINEMDKQMKRIEKIFGYVQGSWGRG